jgi:hypothetical protein
VIIQDCQQIIEAAQFSIGLLAHFLEGVLAVIDPRRRKTEKARDCRVPCIWLGEIATRPGVEKK